MSGIDTIQFADLARQRMQHDATVAGTWTQRHPDPDRTSRTSGRLWRISWHRPARAGLA